MPRELDRRRLGFPQALVQFSPKRVGGAPSLLPAIHLRDLSRNVCVLGGSDNSITSTGRDTCLSIAPFNLSVRAGT
eukprot:7154930-Pyramimonas_sp.AAC.1